MEFDILGPTSVRDDGQTVPIGGTGRRALLTRLIIDANRPVATDRMLEALTVEAGPPPTATTLRSHVGQLRRILGAERLPSVGGGYLLRMADEELDADCFEADLGQAQAAIDGDDRDKAAAGLVRALARWRGPALVDAGGASWAKVEAHRLNDLRRVAEELLLDVRLALGQNEQVVALAQAVVREDPERESVWACLMLAMYRLGRSAEAVHAYQHLRDVLQRAVAGGRAPSAELATLERAILLRDPSLGNARRPTALTPSATPTTVGRTLPGGVVTFLMTDVVGSVRLWESAPAAMRVALARHDELMKIAVESHEGMLVRERGEGDSTFSVFRRATDAAVAALAAQLSLGHEPWPPGCVLRVRMAMHTGEASERDGDYYGRPVNRVARLRAIAQGGQILVGQSAAEILLDHLPAEANLVSLGVVELRDFDRPEAVYVLGFEDSSPSGGPRADSVPTAQVPVVQAADVQAAVLDVPVVHGEAPAARAGDSDPAPTETRPRSWYAVVEGDLGYYQQNGEHDVAFPPAIDRRDIPLTAQTILIGRPSSSHDIEPHIDLSRPFEDPGVSRTHAVLERQPDGSFALVDPGSTNGTFLNTTDHPITPRVPIPLSSGDCIYVGFWTRIQIQDG